MGRKKGSSAQAIQRRAAKLVDADGMIRCKSPKKWEVASQSSSNVWHVVRVTEEGPICDCPYSQKRDAICTHSKAVEMMILQKTFQMKPGTKKVVLAEDAELLCPKGHADLKMDGTRDRKHREPGQRYKCRICGKRLTGGDVGFEGRHYPPAAILLALSLFAIGNSPTSICTTLSTNLNIVVHRTTIQRWADYYMTLVDLYTKSLPIRTGGKWSTDEKYIKILGKEHWLFTVLDCYTRFVLAWKIGIKKDGYNATKLFREAVNRAGCLPVIFCSDSLPSYRKACQKVFNKKRGTKVIHWCDCHLRDIFRNNNMQERANSTFDELIRTRRGPKSENSILFVDAILHYNFIRPHSGIDNKTPAAAANIIINGYNTGHTLIQNAILSA